MNPTVTFIVPCYNLAHVLPECINSILSQSFRDFEVLIMDDCSPDNTPEVARSFNDARVRHVRNEKNLRHLANYNKGIKLAKGEYVWLISADDRLRKPYVLEKYVALLDVHPEVGYVFCPAMSLENGTETELCAYSYHGDQDTVFSGKQFLNKLLEFNSVAAASALARKECYEKVSYFPLDMPYAGDWYVWCVFALHYDVGYFAEAMVNYRQHTQSMTNILKKEDVDILFRDVMSVLVRIRDDAGLENQDAIVLECNRYLVERYLKRLSDNDLDCVEDVVKECEKILGYCQSSQHEWKKLAARFYAGTADFCYTAGKLAEAKTYYKNALRVNWKLQSARLKYLLLALGKTGILARTLVSSVKYRFSNI